MWTRKEYEDSLGTGTKHYRAVVDLARLGAPGGEYSQFPVEVWADGDGRTRR